jgi:lipid II isoglutaminyl synthase (glutamine-hydrolysing)
MTTIRIAELYPLSTAVQGDGGNARALAVRARLRGIEVVTECVHEGAVPKSDILLIAGVDDTGMPGLAHRLEAGGLLARVADGAAVLAVNAGYQVLGHQYRTPDGVDHDGLGILDVTSGRSDSLLGSPVISRPSAALGLAAMSAYESHFGTTMVGPAADCFVDLERGHGNDGRTDGARQGRVIGTYLNGPLLARNADLADLLLGWAVGEPLEPAPATTADALRAQRIREDRADPTGWGGRLYGKARPRRRPSRRRAGMGARS